MTKSFEQLQKEYEIAREEDSKRFDSAPPNMSLQEFKDYMEPTSSVLHKLSKQVRLIQPYILTDFDNIGTLMPIQDFIDCVNHGGFIDYDGFGYYATSTQESDITIIPSDVKAQMIRNDFQYVVWYNR